MPNLKNLHESDEDCAEGDTTLGVVRCDLTQPKEDDDWPCSAIFHTYDKCGEKDCKVIIYAASIESQVLIPVHTMYLGLTHLQFL